MHMQMHIAIECRRQHCRLAELTGAVGAHLLVSEVESTSTSTAARQSGGGPPWAPLPPLAAASYEYRTVQHQAAAGGSVLLSSLTAAVDPSYCFHLSKMEATSDGPYGSSCAVFYLFAHAGTCPKIILSYKYRFKFVLFSLNCWHIRTVYSTHARTYDTSTVSGIRGRG